MSNNQSIDFNDPFFTFFNEPLIAIQRDEELPLSPQVDSFLQRNSLSQYIRSINRFYKCLQIIHHR